MKSAALRLYVVAVTLLLFFVVWAVVAARPWAARAAANPALAALDRRERQLRHEAHVVSATVQRRWAGYRRRLRVREARIRVLEQQHARQVAAAASAAASSAAVAYSAPVAGSQVVTLPPRVQVVTLPPAGASTGSGSSHP